MPTPPMAVPANGGNPTWRIDAHCRGADAERFFTPPHVERRHERRQREAAAVELCRNCPVRAACLDYALTVQEPHGIWGGLTENERRRRLRERSYAQADAAARGDAARGDAARGDAARGDAARGDAARGEPARA